LYENKALILVGQLADNFNRRIIGAVDQTDLGAFRDDGIYGRVARLGGQRDDAIQSEPAPRPSNRAPMISSCRRQ
jgi:hypothetical protein